MRTLSLLSATLVALVTGCASAGMAPAETRSGVLTDPAGMTLYVFDKDVAVPAATTASSPATTAAASGPTRASRCTAGSRTRSRAT